MYLVVWTGILLAGGGVFLARKFPMRIILAILGVGLVIYGFTLPEKLM